MSTKETSRPGHRRRPGRIYYVLASMLIVAGGAFFAWQLYDGLDQAAASLVQLVVPGEVRLELSEAGTYTVFHELQSVIDGRNTQTPGHADVDALVCEVTDATGTAVSLAHPTRKLTYAIGARKGKALYEFEVGAPGSFRLRAHYPGPSTEPPIVLAVGRGLTTLLGRSLMFGGIMLVVALAVGMTTIGVTFSKRNSRRPRRSH